MRKIEFTTGEIYHVYNRGVDKREVFADENDYLRFVNSLYEFNDEQPAVNTNHRYKSTIWRNTGASIPLHKTTRFQLVEILAFSLMPNHYHLMLRQVKDQGITRFMRKLGTGYTMYFNKKYDRTGVLFQGKFKAEHVYNEIHFLHLPHYIHTNPLKLNYRGPTSIKFLMDYRWSSFPDYAGKDNFPDITNRDFLLEIFGGNECMIKYTTDRID
jgi:putative transposase